MTDAQYQTALALFGQGRQVEGFEALRQAAQAGHPPAMALLGRQLIAGEGVRSDTALGMRLILDAAERGEGSACATAATLCVWGYAGQPDWPRALSYLQRAAELGLQPARDQLRLLSGYKAGIDWNRLRRAVDVEAWRKPPPRTTLSEEPLIQAAPGLLSPLLCDALIERARPLLAPALVYNELEGGNTPHPVRRHSCAEFTVNDTDLVIQAITERACAFAGAPSIHAEITQVLHYRPGDYFAPHFDFWDPEFAGHVATLQQGQRAFTVLVYLNHEGLEGGETEFPEVGVRHRGKTGDAVMWRNVDAAGQPDRRTMHAGLPPTRGEKWVLSVWIRDRPAPSYDDPRIVAAMAGR
jgi:prolyl 4-hydroxylase